MLRCSLVLLAVLVVVTPAFAGSWAKVGTTVLLFKGPTIQVEAKGETQVEQLRFKVTDERVKLEKAIVSFADGSNATVELGLSLRPGFDSESVRLPRSGAVTSIELTYNGNAGAKRARLTVYGS